MPRKYSQNIAVDPIKSLGRIATFASFGLFVIIVINYVDARNDYQKEIAEQESLIAQNSEQRFRLDQFHADSVHLNSKLVELDSCAITETELTDVQDQLLAIAKKHGCTIKKASPRGKVVREFVFEQPSSRIVSTDSLNATPGVLNKEFEIHDIGLALNIEGELARTMEFLEAVKKQPWFTSARQLIVRRDPSIPSHLVTELELRFSSIQKTADRSMVDASPAPRT